MGISSSPAPASAPSLLAFEDLVALAPPGTPTPETVARLERLLSTPFISQTRLLPAARRVDPRQQLRIASWNIERGIQWPRIHLALTDPEKFRRTGGGEASVSNRRWRAVKREIAALRTADVLVLNEVDYGTKRTGYTNVAEQLAGALDMGYTFGVEFVEVDPLYTGADHIELDDPQLTAALRQDLTVDPHRYLGLHGNAVLSRLPILSARIHQLPPCYDWYKTEVEKVAAIEKGKRWSAERVFAERIQRQIRRGGRMALIVKLASPEVPGGAITVVATHLEDRSTSACRQSQLSDLLSVLKEENGAVVLAGDFNTSGGDGTPTSIRREVMKRVTDERFWARNALQWFTPLNVPMLVAWPLNYFKNYRDPTAISIPLFASNPERGLFQNLRSFRFSDGGKFDFGGDSFRSGNQREETLANSNQRATKGFEPSFRFERNYRGLMGAFRLDWLFVKPDPATGAGRPHNPLTLIKVNRLFDEPLSDHDPITVDLDLGRAASPAIAQNR